MFSYETLSSCLTRVEENNQKQNREKVKREIQQWMYCITSVKEQFDVRLVIKAPLISWQGFNMFQACSVLDLAHITFYKC